MTRMTLAEVAALTRAGARLIRTWRVPRELAPQILGGPDQPFDTFLMRLTALVGIHASARRLFIHPRRSLDWLHRSNASFDGQSPLQLMARGDMASLYRVRRYLEAEIRF